MSRKRDPKDKGPQQGTRMAPQSETENRKTPKMGRPTRYRAEFCQTLLDHMKQGGSYESFAAVIGVCRDTLYDWEKAHPDFLYTKRRGVDLALLYYENIAKAGITGQLKRLASEETRTSVDTGAVTTTKKYAPATFGQSAFMFTMKNRFPDLYRERVEHTGAGGGPMRYSNMTEAEVDRLLRENAMDLVPSLGGRDEQED